MTDRLSHEDYARQVARESDRFLAALQGAGSGTRVPTCPDWDADDLLWHLSEVQDFWSLLASGEAADGEEAEPLKAARAEQHDDLVSRFESASASLRLALVRAPDTPCWTWYDEDQTVGWVARRQAHEALIHRVDAELTAGRDVTDADPAFAADGVDELLRVFVSGVPGWAEFRPEGGTVRLETTDTRDVWEVVLGGMWGTSPSSGNVYEGLPCVELRDDPVGSADATVRGSAWDLDRWLWGRGDLEVLHVVGDRGVAERLRDTCEVG